MFLLGLFSNLQIIIAFIDVECLVLERVTQQEHNRNQYYESTHGKTSNLTHHKPSRIKRTGIYELLGNLRTMKLVQGKLILLNFSTIFYFFSRNSKLRNGQHEENQKDIYWSDHWPKI